MKATNAIPSDGTGRRINVDGGSPIPRCRNPSPLFSCERKPISSGQLRNPVPQFGQAGGFFGQERRRLGEISGEEFLGLGGFAGGDEDIGQGRDFYPTPLMSRGDDLCGQIYGEAVVRLRGGEITEEVTSRLVGPRSGTFFCGCLSLGKDAFEFPRCLGLRDWGKWIGDEPVVPQLFAWRLVIIGDGFAQRIPP